MFLAGGRHSTTETPIRYSTDLGVTGARSETLSTHPCDDPCPLLLRELSMAVHVNGQLTVALAQFRDGCQPASRTIDTTPAPTGTRAPYGGSQHKSLRSRPPARTPMRSEPDGRARQPARQPVTRAARNRRSAGGPRRVAAQLPLTLRDAHGFRQMAADGRTLAPVTEGNDKSVRKSRRQAHETACRRPGQNGARRQE